MEGEDLSAYVGSNPFYEEEGEDIVMGQADMGWAEGALPPAVGGGAGGVIGDFSDVGNSSTREGVVGAGGGGRPFWPAF